MTKLLIVDDSALMRRLLTDIFEREEGFDIEVARDGEAAIEALHRFKPDVITLDVQMPGVNGLDCLDRIMLERPTPVVMLSSITEQGAQATLEAIELGAVDFFPKPRGAISLEIDGIADDLIATVRAAAAARISKVARLAERLRGKRDGAVMRPKPAIPKRPRASRHGPAPTQGEEPPGLVLVGSSTGGPPALDALLSELPSGLPWPVLIAQHMPASFTGALAKRLDGVCSLDVREVDTPILLAAGNVYVGKGERDLIVARRSGKLVAMSAPSHPDYHWHPSVSRLVDSAMGHLPAARLIGVMLTGMGADGASEMAAMRAAGGRVIAQDEESSVVWGMPGALAKLNGADYVEPLNRISIRLTALLTG
jgi:two-component system chemotaxis response regulator CheB